MVRRPESQAGSGSAEGQLIALFHTSIYVQLQDGSGSEVKWTAESEQKQKEKN